ncbi:MAG: hypothetical protein K0R85_182 [Devosia sp.]|nr:hypothetical protein [Devosia sp.]
MKLRIYPPEGFSEQSSYPHLRHLVRTRTTSIHLHRPRYGFIEAGGPVPELVRFKFVLRRYGYRLG